VSPLAAAGESGMADRALKERMKRMAHGVTGPLVRGLARTGVTPDVLTVTGLVISLVAALAFLDGAFRMGAVLLAVGGVFDLLDGQLARLRGHVTRFGAFLDSTLDRLGEALVLAGISGFYLAHLVRLTGDPMLQMAELDRGLEPRTWAVLAATGVLALIGSFMVSYTRARAEGLGLECRVGLFERPERLGLLILAGLFGVGPVMPAALMLLTLLSFATAIQRVAHVWKHTRGG
jgi:CDP-diacylglycerol--glycerol-3-phosphate 3-phosphatidyltransferase